MDPEHLRLQEAQDRGAPRKKCAPRTRSASPGCRSSSTGSYQCRRQWRTVHETCTREAHMQGRRGMVSRESMEEVRGTVEKIVGWDREIRERR